MAATPFRQAALDRLATPEQLDRALFVTTPRGWLAIAALGTIAGVVIVWAFLGEVATYVNANGILLSRGGTVVDVVAAGSGTVARIAPAVGDVVEGRLGWQEYGLARPDTARKVPFPDIPESTALGILGMPGLTAYFGLLEIGRPVPGDTVVVSAASGAVGAVVGQIARLAGCRVVGIAGSGDKVAYVKGELGFDEGIDHRATEDVGAALDEACPDGVNVYFDNVGGRITDAAVSRLALRARVVVCGHISQYNLERPPTAPSVLRRLLVNQARMEGFIVTSFQARFEEGRARLAQWVRDGKLKYKEDVTDGIENAPEQFIELMRGHNFGKKLIRLHEDG